MGNIKKSRNKKFPSKSKLVRKRRVNRKQLKPLAQPPAKVPRMEAGPSSQDPSVPGPSGLLLPLPLPSTDTDQFLCKVEREDYEEEGEKHDNQDFSTTTTLYNAGPSTSVLNPASKLTHEPTRLEDGTLMVPLPVMEHLPIKQEIDGEDIKPLQALYVELGDAYSPSNPMAPTPVKVQHKPHDLKGHRIVDISYLLQWTMELSRDHFKVCPETDLKVIDEIQDGLRSDFVFHCDKCGFETVKSTMNPETCPTVFSQFYAWKNSLKRSTWLFVHKMLNIFSIPFKDLNVQ